MENDLVWTGVTDLLLMLLADCTTPRALVGILQAAGATSDSRACTLPLAWPSACRVGKDAQGDQDN